MTGTDVPLFKSLTLPAPAVGAGSVLLPLELFTDVTLHHLNDLSYEIFGWDVEWQFTDTTARGQNRPGQGLKQTPIQMASMILKALEDGKTKKPGKVIMLAHDRQFRTSSGHGTKLQEMIQEIKKKEPKATFHTLEDY